MKHFLLIPVVSFFLFFLSSCKKDPAAVINIPVTADTVVMTDTVTHIDTIPVLPQQFYLALGDSYTIGQSVPVSDRYPVQAVALLKKDKINFAAPEIIARTGWTTTNLADAIKNTPPSRSSYDIVTLLIGVNNQYQGLSKDQYKTGFTDLLNKAIQFAGNRKERVIVLSIPDYSVTPYASGSNTALIAAGIAEFNTINKDASVSAGVHYLDITPATRLAATDLSLLATDGLHPSGKEYAVWAEGLAPLIKAALQ